MKVKIPDNVKPVLTIPVELKEHTKAARFAYLAMRNMIYVLQKNTKEADPADFAITLTNNFENIVIAQKLEKEFGSIEKREELYKVLCSEGRNAVNQNEHIALLCNSLKSKGNKVSRNQLVTIYCQLMLECAANIKSQSLPQLTVAEVCDELFKKMLIAVDARTRQFFIEDIVDIFNEV